VWRKDSKSPGLFVTSARTKKVASLMEKDATEPWDDGWELHIADEDGLHLGIARTRLQAVDIMSDAFALGPFSGHGSYRLSWVRRGA
jgi:hypothetical protein